MSDTVTDARLVELIAWLEQPVIQPERWAADVLAALRELRALRGSPPGDAPAPVELRRIVDGLSGRDLNDLAAAVSGRVYGVPHGSPAWVGAERKLDDEKRAAILEALVRARGAAAGARAPEPGTEDVLRYLLWVRHGCRVGALYGDDGEMSCGACGIDFKRWPPEQIQQKWMRDGARSASGERPDS